MYAPEVLSEAWTGVSYKYKTNNHDSLALENEFSFHDYSRHVEHHCWCCSE